MAHRMASSDPNPSTCRLTGRPTQQPGMPLTHSSLNLLL